MNNSFPDSSIESLRVNDWHRRLFDALIPLPDGTSYNAYLVRGAERIALLDTCDPSRRREFLSLLDRVPRVDFIVSHHAEQDHSGLLPEVMARYPNAVVLATPKGAAFLSDLLPLDAARLRAVEDGETLDLGGKTLRFLHLPWVHWPETMVSWLEPDGILFSCDLFGSHWATTELTTGNDAEVLAAAKLYYAQIMMPYARMIEKHLARIAGLPVRMIAPSHGPVFDRPALIQDAWRDWVSGPPQRLVLVPQVSMHGSTALLAERLIQALSDRGVAARPFDLTALPLDRFAAALVDAGAVVFAMPAVWNGPHPAAAFAAGVVNGLKPKARWISWMGSYGWSEKALREFGALLPDLKAEVLPPVLCRGLPRAADAAAVEKLADELAARLPTG